MKKPLGYHILLVLDHDVAASLGLIRALIQQGADLTDRFITLLCCCPSTYWEHGGGTSAAEAAELEQELAAADARVQRALDTANQVFTSARKLLKDAQVPDENIATQICYEGHSLADGVIHELQTHGYSTVIVDKRHQEIVNRLTRRGIWGLLARHTPEVTVWAVDTRETEIEARS